MQLRQLGIYGPRVSALGLGCMGMSDMYGPADEKESVSTIHAALDAGVTLLDTGDFYGMGHNEMLIAKAIKGRPRDKIFLQVKFGAMRDIEGRFLGFDARPPAIKNFIAYSLKRLDTDYIDLYQPARVDPNVPIEDVIGAISDLVRAGYVRHIGLSEAGGETLRKASSIHSIAALQIEYSLASRGIEKSILPTCRDLGIGITAYGVLSRGLLGGAMTTQSLSSKKDFRVYSPRFQGANLTANLKVVERLVVLASRHGRTPAQLALAWVLSRGNDIIPLIGARSRARMAEAVSALDIVLSPEDIAEIEAAVPSEEIVGNRYDEHSMRMLDSEKESAA